jgi:Zn finger protein HypA/HybF involved in hydrogenase expression
MQKVFKCNGCGETYSQEEIDQMILDDTVCCDADGFGLSMIDTSNVKWIKLKEMKEMYSVCECADCGEQRNIDADPSACPNCGNVDFFVCQGAVLELLKRRTKNLVCNHCCEDLSDEYVDAYQHDGGWVIPGVSGRFWLYITCPDCGWETSFSKFGILKK